MLKHARQYVRRAQKVLRLCDYDVRLELADLGEDLYAQIVYERAWEVRIDLGTEWQKLDEENRELILCHELLHLLVRPITEDKAASPCLDLAEERVIQALELVLWNCLKNKKRK